MGFLEAVWARLTANDQSVASPGSPVPIQGGVSPGAQAPVQRTPAAGVEGLAVRCATALPDHVFVNPQRVRWVLLQPEVAAAALRFSSLARLGDKRAAEAQEARDALRTLLVAELHSERPEQLEILFDSMQTTARQSAQYVPGTRPVVDVAGSAHVRPWTAEVPEVQSLTSTPSAPAEDHYPASLPVIAAASTEPQQAERSRPQDALPPDSGSLAPVEYELHVLPGTGIRDLDGELVREYARGATRRRGSAPRSESSELDVLRTVKAIDGPSGRERLTVLGGLFFALQPERLLVQSKVRFVEFPGVEVASTGEKVAYRYSEEITGTITELISRMERLHKERLAPGVLADGFRVEELPSVPLFALREAMVNAVCHRDYSLVGANIQVRLFADRLEVQSPGGLPGPVTVQNILTESYARNPRVADILRELGYVERHGLGIDNMFTSMEEAHLPPPEFSNSATSFTVTLRFRPHDEADPESWLAEIGAAALEHDRQKALVYARRMGRIVAADYRSFSGADEAEGARHLRNLVRDGWLVQNGTRDEAFYTLGPRAAAARESEDDVNPLPQAVLDSLSASHRRILDIVARQGKAKASEVLDISALKDRRTIQRALAALTQRGLLIRRASSPTDPNASYELNRDFHGDGETDEPAP